MYSERAEAPKNRALLPAFLMGGFLLVWNFITFVLGINFRALKVIAQQVGWEMLRPQFAVIGINAGKTLAQALVGAVIVLIIILVCKNRLRVTYKDLIAFALFTVSLWGFGRLEGLFTTVLTGHFVGSSHLAASSAASSVINLINSGVLFGWLCLAVWLLGRAGKKVLSPVLGGCILGVRFFVGICAAVFALPMLRLLDAPESVIDIAAHIVRVSALLSLVPATVEMLFFWTWGTEKMGFVPAMIYGPAQGLLNLMLGYTGAFLVLSVFRLGAAYAGLGTLVAWLLGGVYPVVFAVIGIIRQAKRKA